MIPTIAPYLLPKVIENLARMHPEIDIHIRETLTPKLIREERDSSQQLLEVGRAAAGVEAELMSIVALSSGRALHEQAERQGADLLVVGSCSRGTFGRVMLGDDTRSALNGAPCAVAIAARGFAESSSRRASAPSRAVSTE